MKRSLLFLLLTVSSFISQAQSTPCSFAYVLQADALAKSKADAVTRLAACGRDWIVLDASFSSDEPWTAADLAAIRAGRAGRKVIAYLSIGEAEAYRVYWQSSWSTNPPTFLLGENPEWKGNYRVKYWQTNWQKIILADEDKIMAAGFDGLYLDIVDGFEAFEQDGDNFIDERPNPETGQSYRRDMVDWVKTVAARARRANPAALVIPQNGTQLLTYAYFLSTVDAVGVEDLFTEGDKLQRATDTKHVIGRLAAAAAARKPVLDVEYARRPDRRKLAQNLAAQHGFIWIITDRELKTLGESGK